MRVRRRECRYACTDVYLRGVRMAVAWLRVRAQAWSLVWSLTGSSAKSLNEALYEGGNGSNKTVAAKVSSLAVLFGCFLVFGRYAKAQMTPPAEGETASPEELEMEIVIPEEGDRAASEELELEIVTPEEGERAASGELEIEIVTRQDGQAASADDLDIEIIEPETREEALELDIIRPGQLEIVSP